MDFTLTAYGSILDGLAHGGYHVMPIVAWLDGNRPEGPVALVRHDIDRQPTNALAMARLESRHGVRATYYFRILPVAFDREIIAEIAGLGHEIGYHYEDLHLAGYDEVKAIGLFRRHLARLREVAPVRTIAMHGSPLSRRNNMEIWDRYDYREHGVEDCIRSADYSEFVFFTDTGRSFGRDAVNLRDYIGGRRDPRVSTSADVARCLAERRHPRIQINVHPERWNQPGLPWIRQWAWDMAANSAKRVLRIARRELSGNE